MKDRVGRRRVLSRIDRLANGNPGDVRPVSHGVSELRLTYGPGYRVYYLQDGDTLILLLIGGDKSTQRKDIAKAHELAEAYWTDRENDDEDE